MAKVNEWSFLSLSYWVVSLEHHSGNCNFILNEFKDFCNESSTMSTWVF